MASLTRVLWVLLLMPAALASRAEPSGTITAKVVDQSGNPVAGATAQMVPADGKIMAMAIPQCLTDENGVCSYSHLHFGKYHVNAMKNADGYPDVHWDLYGHGKSKLTAEVTAEAHSVSVSITLGPRAASMVVGQFAFAQYVIRQRM